MMLGSKVEINNTPIGLVFLKIQYFVILEVIFRNLSGI